MLEKESQNMKTYSKSDPKMVPKSIKNNSKSRCEKRDEKIRFKIKVGGPILRSAEVAVSPNPIISKDILRSEVRRKYTKKVE